jgi:hypothetical protein
MQDITYIQHKPNKIIRYISIGLLICIMILIILRLTSCDKNNKNEKTNKTNKLSFSDSQKNENNQFLNQNVYQNVPISYDYLVNYPNGPHSWGEWGWGKRNTKNKSNYSTL